MAGQSYRDLVAWQRAMDLWFAVHEMTQGWPREERFESTSQVRRAANSVPANIAEGQGRQCLREFLHHVSIANGSLFELETHLIGAARFGYLDAQDLDILLRRTAEDGRLLNGLMRNLRLRCQPKQAPRRRARQPLTTDYRLLTTDYSRGPRCAVPTPSGES
jgi:four helix bundle protein